MQRPLMSITAAFLGIGVLAAGTLAMSGGGGEDNAGDANAALSGTAAAMAERGQSATAHVHSEPEPVDDTTMPLASTETGHRHGPVKAAEEQIACGNDLVRRTQEATARLVDYNVALAEGYRPNPQNPEGNHYGNPLYRRDGVVFDLARPETLIYWTNRTTGEKVLLGVMFTMPRGQAGPQPCGPVTWWHTHTSCHNRQTGESLTIQPGATCPAGYRYFESAEMMHVWFVPGRGNGVAPTATGGP